MERTPEEELTAVNESVRSAMERAWSEGYGAAARNVHGVISVVEKNPYRKPCPQPGGCFGCARGIGCVGIVDTERVRTKVSPTFEAAGPEAVALRERYTNVAQAEDALGLYIWESPGIAGDRQLSQLAEHAADALANLRAAISAKLRKLCGVVE